MTEREEVEGLIAELEDHNKFLEECIEDYEKMMKHKRFDREIMMGELMADIEERDCNVEMIKALRLTL